jgi:hypothetical protein
VFNESKLVIICRLLLDKAKGLGTADQDKQSFLVDVKEFLKIVQAVVNLLLPLQADTTDFRLAGTFLTCHSSHSSVSKHVKNVRAKHDAVEDVDVSGSYVSLVHAVKALATTARIALQKQQHLQH